MKRRQRKLLEKKRRLKFLLMRSRTKQLRPTSKKKLQQLKPLKLKSSRTLQILKRQMLMESLQLLFQPWRQPKKPLMVYQQR